MTKTADVKDVAANFTHWLKEVAAGHEVVVTENDRPVARVLAAAEEARSLPQPAGQPTTPAPLGLPVFHGHKVLTPHITSAEIAEEMFDRR
ncbi:MAG: type II toxin-antitoxin system prevent-host-death family antitoxin [Verrucomicrobiae bacterium]|nr:type II toxin-antitoxin system prevent-host-death family antitoxin [Verrucomicrobiae bacterium]